MRSLAQLALATVLAGSTFLAFARASSQFGRDLVAVAVPAAPLEPPTITPMPDAGVEVAQLAVR